MSIGRSIIMVAAVIVGVLSAQSATAASTNFTTTQQIGVDNVPPTIPTPVTATPVAATQIDITWGASTDNFGLAGYQLFRDGIQIATTTSTTYFDINLQPETLYSYHVTAFDTFNNISTSSATVATTTLAVPVVPVASTSSQVSSGSQLRLVERNFDIIEGSNSARVEWETNLATQFVLRYGLTREMDDEIIQTSIFRRGHSTFIGGLVSATTYFYEVVLIDTFGREQILRTGEFRTLEGVDITPPANVQNLAGQVVGNDVYLSWSNPIDSDFASVRVVRNHRFFPQNPTDGFVVYEGDSTTVIDQAAFSTQSRQYYTVFSYDGSGNRSSGAVLTLQDSSLIYGDTLPLPDQGDATATGTPVGQTDIRLRAEDISFWQGTMQTAVSNGVVALQAYDGYRVVVPASAVPNHLKSIIITVQHPTNNQTTQSFLLRYDKDSHSYQATIAPFSVLGGSLFTVVVYDYTAAVVHEVTLPVQFVGSQSDQSVVVAGYLIYAWSVLWPLLQLLLIGLTFVWFLVLWRRHHEPSAHLQ